MIDPKWIDLKTAHEPYLSMMSVVVLHEDESEHEDETVFMTTQNLLFLFDHEHWEVAVFCVGFDSLDSARARLMQRMGRYNKRIKVSSITDFSSEEEYQKVNKHGAS